MRAVHEGRTKAMAEGLEALLPFLVRDRGTAASGRSENF